MSWHGLNTIGPMQFRCGFCGLNVASDVGYFDEHSRRIRICINCSKPTFFDRDSRQYPGVAPGNEVQHIPEELKRLYREARDCCSVSAYTASVLATRKMLMSIAVEQGATEGLKFIEYVEYLASNGFIPPNGRSWVDHIRQKGNEATHEISLMAPADAENLVTFMEMLLKFIYEFPNRVPAP